MGQLIKVVSECSSSCPSKERTNKRSLETGKIWRKFEIILPNFFSLSPFLVVFIFISYISYCFKEKVGKLLPTDQIQPAACFYKA